MNRLLRISLLLCLTLQLDTILAQNGAITGIILDEYNLAMPGANIFVPELERGAVSDPNGRFEIVNIPEGNYELNISFMGYETHTESVTVSTSQSNNLKIILEPSMLIGDEVIVMGDRLKGQAKALNDQKNKSNITNIVAADQIGRFPDANVGDALKRIPGITIQNDQGEARDIIVRGMAPQLNSVTINGERIPSAEGDNRRIQMDLIPADMIQLIEVNKVVTPDMDADAIGGSINLVTRSVTNKRISGTIASGYNFLSKKPIWTGGLILSNRFFDSKFGAVLSMSYNNHQFGSDNIEAEWIDHETYGVIPDEFQLRTYQVQRVRRSLSLGLDYQFNPNNTIYLSGIYNWRDDWENRFRFVAKDIGDAADDGLFTPVSSGIWDIEATAERQTKGGIGNDRIDNRRLEDQRTANMTLKGEHLLANKIKLLWSGTYARASEERLNERYVEYKGKGISMRLNNTNTKRPLVYSINENQWDELELNELTEENQFTAEEDLNGRIDLHIPFASSKGMIKLGGLYRSKTKERNNSFFEYVPTGGTTEGQSHPDFGGSWNVVDGEFTDILMAEVPVSDQSKSDFLVGSQYQAGNFIDKTFLGGLDLENDKNYEKSDKPGEYAPSNYTADESITGAYLMADFNFNQQLSAIAGARLENTSISYKGFSYDDDTEEVGTTSGSNDYMNILPNVQLKYNIKPKTILRAAYSNTIARPGYFQLVPFEEYIPEDAELIKGNPELKPTTSMNLDLMAEQYFENIGIFSVGGFYKNVKDFIYEQELKQFNDSKYGLVDLTVFNNGPKANVYGIETSFQKQFKGIGIYLNYTFSKSTTEGIEGREEENLALPGTAPHMFNASLSYETKALVLRVSFNYASDYIDELGGEAFEDRFYDKQSFLDFNGSYALNKNWRVFLEWNNITNQPLRFYQGRSDLTMQEEAYNMRFNMGVKFDFSGK